MLKEIIKYVCICSNYQQVQVHHHKLYEKLMFIFSESVNLFHMMIMNFITDMLFAKNLYIEKTSDVIVRMHLIDYERCMSVRLAHEIRSKKINE